MPRYCFELHVRPERMEEYVERHRTVWPEMREALAQAGWRNYSLFLREGGLLIGYVEADDLAAAQQAMAATEVNARWQAEMAPFFVDLDGPPDQGLSLLREVFHLPGLPDPHRDGHPDTAAPAPHTPDRPAPAGAKEDRAP